MLHRSLYPDILLPQVDIFHFLFETDGRQKDVDKVIFVDGENHRKMTVSDVHKKSKRLANALHTKYNVKRGQRVAIYSFNDFDYPIMVFGILAAGLTVTTISSYYTVDEVVHQLHDSEATIIFVDRSLAAKGKEAAAKAGILPENVIISGIHKGNLADLPFEGHPSIHSLIETYEEMEAVRLSEDEVKEMPGLICYSSGTTGKPKGVLLTHYNIVSNMHQYSEIEKESWAMHPDNGRYIIFLPFFHMYALGPILLSTVTRRSLAVIMPRYDFEKFLQLTEQYKITMAYIVPPVCLALSKHPLVDKYDISSLREVFSAAAPLGADLANVLKKRLNVTIREGYGMTEVAPLSHSVPVSELIEGSIGRLFPNMTAKIIDEDGNALSYGQRGELCLSGPNIMKGYLNRPDATAACIDEDGFLHTGDVVYADERGHFFIVDRLKEFIKYNAFQVAPAEIEEILQVHEAVSDACVVGYHCPERATELLMAFVSLKSEYADQIKDTDLIEFAATRSAPYKKLRGGIEFVPEIPRSASGKILRRVMRELAKSRAEVIEANKIEEQLAEQTLAR
ncbi:hypothetical protein BDF19DRAFT_404406 [Syncephalis fuscata]|nr:hypothetical protein BDF19DRAFT_404406 [Syncephalis fuscata]